MTLEEVHRPVSRADSRSSYSGGMAAPDVDPAARRQGEAWAREAFERLDLPEAPTTDGLVAHVAELRNRPIHVAELPGLVGTRTCGWWAAFEDRDEILIATPLSDLHRDALVLHELGHLVLDLTGVAPAGAGEAAALPGPATGAAIRARRSHFTDATEIAAELLADALHREIRRGPRRASRFLTVFS